MQKSSKVRDYSATLDNIGDWITAWADNIESFRSGYISFQEESELVEATRQLEYYILSQDSPESYSHILASWAAKAGMFPSTDRSRYTRIIRCCFNSEKIFSIPLAEIQELKEYCEQEIEPGTIYYHKLVEVLAEGIKRNTGYLGQTSYTLLGAEAGKGELELASIHAKYSELQSPPNARDYPTKSEFVKAKLAYRLNCIKSAEIQTASAQEIDND